MKANSESRHLLTECPKLGRSNDDNEIEATANKSQGKSIWRDTNRIQKITFIFAGVSTASVYFCFGIPLVFFSRVVVAKGGYKLYASAILGSTSLFSSIASLFCGKYQSRISSKAFVWIGLLTIAVTQGGFGTLQYVNNMYVFVTVGIILKATQGIGVGFTTVALLTMLWHEIPEHVGKSFGMTRAMVGVGFLFSSFVSGYLYSIQNGMMIPCVVSAILPLVLSFIGWLILPSIENTVDENTDYHTWRYICNPKSVFVLGLASTCGAAFAVSTGSLSSYAQSVGVSVVNLSLILTVSNAAVIVVSSLAGYFANANHACRQISIAILFLGMIAVNITFTENETLPLLCLQVVVYVVTASGVRTLAFPEMVHQSLVDDTELVNNFAFRSQLSGVWYFATSIPSFLFGVGGTALQNVLSYSMSQIISSLVGLFVTGIATMTVYLYRCQRVHRRQ